MRSSITVLAGLFLAVTLCGCGASPTIPKPPATETNAPPPGTSADMTTVKKGSVGGVGAARPAGK